MPKDYSHALEVAAVLFLVLATALFAGYTIGSVINGQSRLLNSGLSDLQSELAGLQSQLSYLQSGTNRTIYVTGSLSALYQSVKDSIVTVDGALPQNGSSGGISYSEVIGSGFVVNLTGTPLIVTNYHVIDGMVNGSVTFTSGEAYPFKVVGSDPYSDLAVLQVEGAPAGTLIPLDVVSSGTLQVGDVVIAVGNPYGLQGTLDSGIVSQLDRAIQSNISEYQIAGLIQISTPINVGNSGSPLFDSEGNVVGVANAIIQGSNNVGFAITSDTLIKEIPDLVATGSYSHSYMGISGLTLDYLVSQAAGLNITYGVLIQSVAPGSPAAAAGLRGGTSNITVAGQTLSVGGDVIIQAGSQRITSIDGLSSYLAENTTPGQTVNFTIIRDGSTLVVPVVLGSRSL